MMMKFTCILALVWLIVPAGALAEESMIPPLTDTVVDSAAWNFPDGRWGTCVNGQTFQQEAVLTHLGHQYAAFFADGGVLAIGRRKLPEGDWEVIRFADYKARDHRDAHNVVSMGIAPGDGTIHLMFDHHNDPLHYRRSVQGLTSRPDDFEWKAEHFGPVTSRLDGKTIVKGVTYPQMVATPDGGLQLLYRIGGSGDGSWIFTEYDPAGQGAWHSIGTLFTRTGQYRSSPSRCAYPNPLRYDADGRLHVTWCWRERPADAPFDLRTNHDLLYAYSDDAGRTWKNNAGDAIASLPAGESIGIDTPGTIIHPIHWLRGQMNTSTQAIDARGRVHVINWQQPPDAEHGSKDLNTWRYYHYWRDTDGAWRENALSFVGRKPQIIFDSAGNAIVVFTKTDNANYHGQDPGGTLRLMTASEASHWTDWKPVYTTDRASVGEPLLDHTRWAADGTLSIYLQDKPSAPGEPSSLRVIDFKLAR